MTGIALSQRFFSRKRKWASTRQLAWHNQTVDITFGNVFSGLIHSLIVRVTNRYTGFSMVGKRFSTISIPQRLRYIRTTEQNLVILNDGSHVPELWVCWRWSCSDFRDYRQLKWRQLFRRLNDEQKTTNLGCQKSLIFFLCLQALWGVPASGVELYQKHAGSAHRVKNSLLSAHFQTNALADSFLPFQMCLISFHLRTNFCITSASAHKKRGLHACPLSALTSL